MKISAGPISLQEKAESEGELHGKDCTDYHSFLHFLRQSTAKPNATSEVTSRQSAFMRVIGSFCQWLKGQYNPWPSMYTQRSGKAGEVRESYQGEQQELIWIILEDQHTCLRVRPLVTTDAGIFPKSN